VQVLYWKKPARKRKNLIRLGVPKGKSFACSRTRKGGWAIAKSPILTSTITLERLGKRGYACMDDCYEKASLMFNEPLHPDKVGIQWCERHSLPFSAWWGRLTCWPSVHRVAVCLSQCWVSVSLSTVFVGAVCWCIFIFFEALDFFSNNFISVVKASSFAIFGLCVGLCEFQMCLLLAIVIICNIQKSYHT